MTTTASQRVHDRLSHPVVDSDGHWIEPAAIFFDYLKMAGGQSMVDDLLKVFEGFDRWYATPVDERRASRLARPAYWALTTETKDRATAMIPRLLHERLPEFGIDFSIVYPTLGLQVSSIPQPDLRRAAVRALNTMAAEMFRPYADRMTPAALVCPYTPEEAIDEAEHIVKKLGLKVAMLKGAIPRVSESSGGRGRSQWIDNLALDSAHDYEPFFAKLIELKLAYTNHSGSAGSGAFGSRHSPTSFAFNHVGHFADSHHGVAKGLFLAGVTERFPHLNFAFLEGGVGWAVNLYRDLIEHWEKLNQPTMHSRKPSDMDTAELRRLFGEYATDAQYAGKVEDIIRYSHSTRPTLTAEELTDRDIAEDEFSRVHISGEADISRLFAGRFYFGCEADDRLTALAFNDGILKTTFKPILGSDIGHFDVPDMTDILHEAWELVEDGLINEEQLRELTFSNAVALHGQMNPDFFKGTVVEAAAAKELAAA